MSKWGYGKQNGPASWAKEFPDAGGDRQSPINIETSKAKFDQSYVDKPLRITYQPEASMCVSNTGASVKVDCERDDCTMTGGPLGGDVYRLIQFHLHWGSCDEQGAEHTIDGKVYAAELHLVHWNCTKYGSFGEAVDKSDGLAVLCMFIEVGDKAHEEFEMVSSALGKTKCCGENCKLTKELDPSKLLPGNTEKYWTYPGSLTTPPCYESVQFILFKESLQFSRQQMNALRSMKFGGDDSECNMVDNFRPTVSLGSRTVRASFVN